MLFPTVNILSTVKMAKLFECDQCDFKYKTKSKLTSHHNSLYGNIKYKCKLCGNQFSTKRSLTEHQQSIHEGKKFPCSLCEHVASNRGNLSTSYLEKDPLRSTSCQYMKEGNFPVSCHYQATLKASLIKHQQSVHEGIMFPCDSCDYQASSRGNLATHQQSVQEGRKFPCGSCDYQASSRGNLSTHQKSLHEGRMFPCIPCVTIRQHRNKLHTSRQYMKEQVMNVNNAVHSLDIKEPHKTPTVCTSRQLI